MLARVDDNPAFFRLALRDPGRRRPGTARRSGTELALIGLDIARLLRDLVVDGVGAGDFRAVDPDLAIGLIGQQIYGAMAVRAGEPVTRRPVRRRRPTPCAFILHGLAA